MILFDYLQEFLVTRNAREDSSSNVSPKGAPFAMIRFVPYFPYLVSKYLLNEP